MHMAYTFSLSFGAPLYSRLHVQVYRTEEGIDLWLLLYDPTVWMRSCTCSTIANGVKLALSRWNLICEGGEYWSLIGDGV
ncbi:hypothetical protein Hanom_Chr08g00708181 [Helianthus anomalus]